MRAEGGDFVERTAAPPPVDQVGTRDTVKKSLHLSRPAETPSVREVMGDLAVGMVGQQKARKGMGRESGLHSLPLQRAACA